MAYNVKLLDKTTVAENTMSFRFEKPEAFEFKAGQFIGLKLINPTETDDAGDFREFSIASLPEDPHLMIATRIRDTAFKRNLKNMNLGEEIELTGPFGTFILRDEPSTVVLIAGGIGVTLARSIILDATKKKLPHKIFLFYSNRRPEDAAFLNDLFQAEKENPNFKFIPTMTQPEKSNQGWSGDTGHVTKEMIEKYVPEISSATYYLSGPVKMVTAMKHSLLEIGISGDKILTEEFWDY